MRIPADNQRDLLSPAPSLELRFSGERFMYIIIGFTVQEPSDAVFSGEAFEMMELVLEYAFVQVSAEPNIESSR